VNAPSPKYLARAIGDALAPKARKAQDYLDEWGVLARAGVPAEHARAVLDQKRQETSSTVAIANWDGRGWLGLCGDYGPGKTFAAACWLLEQSRRGRSICWLNAVRWSQLDLDAKKGENNPNQKHLVRQAVAAQALVFDDIGAGVTKRKAAGRSDWFAQQLEGVIMDRGAKPTITASNDDVDEVADWLGQRLLDRLRTCGGLEQIRGPSLRRDRPDPHDDDGRSPTWHQARKLVDQLGIRWASVWTDGRDVEHVVVGEKLELRTDSRYRASSKPDPEARVHALAEALDLARRGKLDLEVMTATALELEANDPAKLLAAKVVETLEQDTPMARSKRRFAASIAADNAARSRTCYDTLADMTSRLGGEPHPGTVVGKHTAREPAAWTMGHEGQRKMSGLGYSVRETSSGYEVRRGARGKARGQMVLPGQATERDAWNMLRLLLSPPPDDDPRATSRSIEAAELSHGLRVVQIDQP
jgi:hypothetical protein